MGTRKAALPPERRDELLDVATREFADNGFDGASLNRIIRACGMSKSSFYYYYESKEALFDAAVTRIVDGLRGDLKIPDPGDLAAPGFWDEVERVGTDLMQVAGRNPRLIDFWRLFYATGAPSGEGSPLGRARAGIDDWLGRALAAGRAAGAVRDDMPPSLQGELTLAALWTIDAWALRNLWRTDADEAMRIKCLQVGVIRRMVGTG
ncbi:TetR/AcrR family transcriptional regulator [Actinomadura darangshiensis]|uniref:TetR/AcrR family transcriptional regulator n=1 Tax=Actinomadura darangshiensis TaxID=705336 RepID=UPI001409A772|nr:TetR/AcrR family transcriptional regulator [Actinomadura darangshiensis]